MTRTSKHVDYVLEGCMVVCCKVSHFGMTVVVDSNDKDITRLEQPPPLPIKKKKRKPCVIDPTDSIYTKWLGVIAIAVFYNLFIVVFRSVFWELQERYLVVWLTFDYLMDLIYILDMVVKFRTGYMDGGILVTDTAKIRRLYMKTWEFKLDILSILPLDIFYSVFGINTPQLRFGRLFKINRAFEFFNRVKLRTSYPNLVRMVTLFLYVLIVIHWNACGYFQISGWLGYGSTKFVFKNLSSPDIRELRSKYFYSFYWSSLTLCNLGETEHPETDFEHIYVTIDILGGLLIFAAIIGDVGNMIANLNAVHSKFHWKLDGVKHYMKMRNISDDLQAAVLTWFQYIWATKNLEDERVLEGLPHTLRTEIAMQAHLETLERITIFKNCDTGLLLRLVLKLKLEVYCAGDYICRKGDIGTEMYIVKQGKLEVVADDQVTVYATLTEGSVFGELSLIHIAGNKTGNRRTANVRSIGFAELFVLSKHDLWEALAEYPEAEKVMIERGRRHLKEVGLLDESRDVDVARKESTIDKLERIGAGISTLDASIGSLMREMYYEQRMMKQELTKLESKAREKRNKTTHTLH